MAAILGPLILDKKLNFEQYLLNTHWYYTLQIHGITRFPGWGSSKFGEKRNKKKKMKINIAVTNIAEDTYFHGHNFRYNYKDGHKTLIIQPKREVTPPLLTGFDLYLHK